MTGPLAPVPNALRVDLTWSTAGDTDIMNHLFFKYSGGPPNATDCTSFASSITSAVIAEFAEWATTVSLTTTTVTDLSTVTGGQGKFVGNTPGGRTEQPLSAGTAVVVNFGIARRYRGGKPRIYLPWGVSSDLTDRRDWEGAFITAVDNAFTSIIAGIVGLTSGSTTISGQVNISYFTGFTVVTNPTTGRARNVPKRRIPPIVDDVLSHAASTRPGSQRRRN